jgi:hypothetical protein
MYNIQQPQTFFTLKEYYLPAIHHPILVGKKKMYSLSVPLGGKEVQIKRSSKKIKHASFAKVILGCVLRMQKLFQPDKLNLAVIINKRPNEHDLTLEFELVNLNKFIIANEEYFLTIVANYSYSKPDKVTYYPILYRQWCINGAVSILSEQFKEVILADKILEIGCEWTRCNFESYKNMATSYFETLRRSEDNTERLRENANRLSETLFNSIRSRSNSKMNLLENDYPRDRRSVNSYFSKNIEILGNNQFAVFNALTEFASQEENLELRYQYFISIGKYLSKEMRKTAKLEKEYWSESVDWDALNHLTKK